MSLTLLFLNSAPAEIVLKASANIAASGEATTAQLTAPSGKTSGANFQAGRLQDDENPTDAIDLAADKYTELEWSIQVQAGASPANYEFRVVKADGTPLDTYSTPILLTIGSADTVAPTMSAQTVGTLTTSGGVPQVTTNEANGTAYMVVVPDGNSPSVAQIKAGQNASGGAALASENKAVSATGAIVFSAVSGLVSNTPYDVWFVHTDAATNDSTAVKADFTTVLAFNDARQAIINGLDSAQAEAAGWDVLKASIPVSAVVRTSATVVTITLPALSSYSITADETITATIPASALTANAPIVAAPTIGIANAVAGAALTGVAATSSRGTVTAVTSVAVTGQVGTGDVGSVAQAHAQALTSAAGTGSVGTVAESSAIGLSGQAGTGAVGTTATTRTVALTGQSGTGTVGTLTATTGAVAALVGVSAAGAVGTLTAVGGDVSAALAGQGATGSAGTVASTRADALTGTTSAGAVGTLAPSSTKALTGVSSAGAVGTITASAVTTAALTGVQGTGVVGSVTQAHGGTIALAGVSATGVLGTVGASGSGSATLTGVTAAGSRGTLAPTIAPGLVGKTATGTPGTVGHTVTVALAGVQATGEVGTLLTFAILPTPDVIVRVAADDVVVRVSSDEIVVRVASDDVLVMT